MLKHLAPPRDYCPCYSPYASEIVIVHEKTGEIHLCVDYRKLNSISIMDAFPLPHIDEALQVVHSGDVFTSLTWHKYTCSWLWQKLTSKRLHLYQVLQAYTNVLIYLLARKMLGQASAG